MSVVASTNFFQVFILFLAFCSIQTITAAENSSNLPAQLLQRVLRESDQPSDLLTLFPQVGDYEWVLDNKDNFKFNICCSTGTCIGRLLYCFSTTDQSFQRNTFGCGVGTCAYKFEYAENGVYYLNDRKFVSTGMCLTGEINQVEMYVSNSSSSSLDDLGCPLKVDAENRFKIYVKSTPSGVTVNAINAKKYVEPTTQIPQIDQSGEAASSEEGMSNGLLYGLIGGGIFVIVLIIAIVVAVVYFCFCKRKNAKKASPLTVIKASDQKEEKKIVEKPVQPKMKAVNVDDDVKSKAELSKAPPPPLVVASAEPPASKEPIAPSAEPLQKQAPVEPARSPPKPRSHSEPGRKGVAAAAAVIPRSPSAGNIPTLIDRSNAQLRRPFKKNDTFEKLKKVDIESSPDSMVRGGLVAEKMALRQPSEQPRKIDPEDVHLFSLSIGDMFPKLENRIDEAMKEHEALEKHAGRSCPLMNDASVPYFTSHYAFTHHYCRYFKKLSENLGGYSIPLLLCIAMDRCQTVEFVAVHLCKCTKTIPLKDLLTEPQQARMLYPTNVIFLSFKHDDFLVRNAYRLHTFSSPNNSECCKSDEKKKLTAGATTIAESVTSVNGDAPSKENVVNQGDGKKK